MTIYKEKCGTRRDGWDADWGHWAEVAWTDVPWDEGHLIPRAQPYAAHDEFPELKCINRRRKGIGQPNERGRYTKCVVMARYETRPEDEGGEETGARFDLDFGEEVVTLDGTVTWTTGGATIKTLAPTIRIPVVYVRITEPWAEIPLSLWKGLKGKISNSIVHLLDDSLPAGTLRFDGGSSYNELSPAGKLRWQTTARFAINRQGWNHLPKVSNGDIVWDTTSPLRYETTNLNRLFRD